MNSGKRAGSLAAVFAAVLCVVGYLAYFGHVSVVPKQAVGGVLIGPVGPPLNGGTPSTPAPGTPAYNPSWYAATNIYLDHSGAASTGAGNDSNNCTALATPCLTIAEVYRRYGSHYASLNPNQVTTLNVVVGQTLAQGKTDPYGVIGFAAPGNGGFVLQCALQAQGPTFLAGTVTQISRGNPGNDFQVQLGTGVDAGAAPVAGDILYDATVSGGSYCWIDSMAANLATCSNPVKGTSLTTMGPANSFTANGSSWASGDTLQVYTSPTIYAESIQTTSDTVSNVGTNGFTGTNGCTLGTLYSGTTGVDIISVAASGRFIMALTSSSAYVVVNGSNSGGNALAFVYPSLVQDFFNGGVSDTSSGYMVAGSVNTAATANDNMFSNSMQIHNDTIMHGKIDFVGYNQMYNLHLVSGSQLTVYSGTSVMRAGTANGII